MISYISENHMGRTGPGLEVWTQGQISLMVERICFKIYMVWTTPRHRILFILDYVKLLLEVWLFETEVRAPPVCFLCELMYNFTE